MNGICISYFFGDFSKPLGDFSLKHPVTLLAHAVNKTKIQKGGFFHRIFLRFFKYFVEYNCAEVTNVKVETFKVVEQRRRGRQLKVNRLEFVGARAM
jgi:hypothetical protein